MKSILTLVMAVLASSSTTFAANCTVQKISDKTFGYFNYFQYDTIYAGNVPGTHYLIVKDDGSVETKSILKTTALDAADGLIFGAYTTESTRAVEISLLTVNKDSLSATYSAGGLDDAALAVRAKGIVVSCSIK